MRIPTPAPWTFEVCESSTMIHSPEGYIAEFSCDDHAANAELVCNLRNGMRGTKLPGFSPVVAFLEVTGDSGGGSSVCLTHDDFFDGEIDVLHKSNVAILPLELWEERIKPLMLEGKVPA